MSYINKKSRVFREFGSNLRIERRRSEARLKAYPSATDARAWCDIVEDRRQHILELINTSWAKCSTLGKLVPIETIIDLLMASKNADIRRLKKSLSNCETLIENLDLTDEQRKKLAMLRDQLARGDKIGDGPKCRALIRQAQEKEDTQGGRCKALIRQAREKAAVDALIKEAGAAASDSQPRAYKKSIVTDAQRPSRVTTTVKGMVPSQPYSLSTESYGGPRKSGTSGSRDDSPNVSPEMRKTPPFKCPADCRCTSSGRRSSPHEPKETESEGRTTPAPDETKGRKTGKPNYTQRTSIRPNLPKDAIRDDSPNVSPEMRKTTPFRCPANCRCASIGRRSSPHEPKGKESEECGSRTSSPDESKERKSGKSTYSQRTSIRPKNGVTGKHRNYEVSEGLEEPTPTVRSPSPDESKENETYTPRTSIRSKLSNDAPTNKQRSNGVSQDLEQPTPTIRTSSPDEYKEREGGKPTYTPRTSIRSKLSNGAPTNNQRNNEVSDDLEQPTPTIRTPSPDEHKERKNGKPAYTPRTSIRSKLHNHAPNGKQRSNDVRPDSTLTAHEDVKHNPSSDNIDSRDESERLPKRPLVEDVPDPQLSSPSDINQTLNSARPRNRNHHSIKSQPSSTKRHIEYLDKLSGRTLKQHVCEEDELPRDSQYGLNIRRTLSRRSTLPGRQFGKFQKSPALDARPIKGDSSPDKMRRKSSPKTTAGGKLQKQQSRQADIDSEIIQILEDNNHENVQDFEKEAKQRSRSMPEGKLDTEADHTSTECAKNSGHLKTEKIRSSSSPPVQTVPVKTSVGRTSPKYKEQSSPTYKIDLRDSEKITPRDQENSKLPSTIPPTYKTYSPLRTGEAETISPSVSEEMPDEIYPSEKIAQPPVITSESSKADTYEMQLVTVEEEPTSAKEEVVVVKGYAPLAATGPFTRVATEKPRDNSDNLKDAVIPYSDNELKNQLQLSKNKLVAAGDKITPTMITSVPTSSPEDILALENEIETMRSGSLSPEQEAEVIRKEVEVLKRYCANLKSFEEENQELKKEIEMLRAQNTVSCEASVPEDAEIIKSQMAELKDKLKYLAEMETERDMLLSKVDSLQKELLTYQDLPNEIEGHRRKSKILDEVLAERDNLSKRVEELKGLEEEMKKLQIKAERVNQLERELNVFSENDRTSTAEMQRVQSKCSCLERELSNLRAERDAMNKRIHCMKNEIECLQCKARENEMLRLERDRLQMKLSELATIKREYDEQMSRSKNIDVIITERDTYKQKYEELLQLQTTCEMLKKQVETAKDVSREKDILSRQVQDLESCIGDQECEIKRLVGQIDEMTRCRGEQETRMKEALAQARAEVDKKNYLIAASEEKLASVQEKLKNSIQGVSCETSCLKSRIEQLEKELAQSQTNYEEKQCQVKYLQHQIKEKDKCLSEMENEKKNFKKITKHECDAIIIMKRELESARLENKKLQEIAKKMVSLTGDEHVQQMLRQSECAVKRVVEELGKQYQEWDHIKNNIQCGGKICAEKQVQVKKDVEKCVTIRGLSEEEERRVCIRELIAHLKKSREKTVNLEKENARLRLLINSNLETDNETCKDMENSSSCDKLRKELDDIQNEKDKLQNLIRDLQENKFSNNKSDCNDIECMKQHIKILEQQLQKEMKLRLMAEKKSRGDCDCNN